MSIVAVDREVDTILEVSYAKPSVERSIARTYGCVLWNEAAKSEASAPSIIKLMCELHTTVAVIQPISVKYMRLTFSKKYGRRDERNIERASLKRRLEEKEWGICG